MSDSAGVSRKAEDTYPTSTPGPCSQFLVASELLIYFCYFVLYYSVFYVLCCVCLFPCLGLFLDNILLISLESWFLLLLLLQTVFFVVRDFELSHADEIFLEGTCKYNV